MCAGGGRRAATALVGRGAAVTSGSPVLPLGAAPDPGAEGGRCGGRLDAAAAGGAAGPRSEPALRADEARSGLDAQPAAGDTERTERLEVHP